MEYAIANKNLEASKTYRLTSVSPIVIVLAVVAAATIPGWRNV
jgi:hypothetical protein